jgi:phosphatidylethanolamine/phosphatidyl-N-methylethanolamine N-methyltransferase
MPVSLEAELSMDEQSIKQAYARWAPIYDAFFGSITFIGRKAAVKAANLYQGKVLEVGVGTGIALPLYAKHLTVTGIDLSLDMLKLAHKRAEILPNVTGVLQMDAGKLAFNAESFETVVAMYLITVVPDPEGVMRELARVVKLGGEVILVNHFSATDGIRAFVEKLMSPFASKLGWRPEFAFERVLQEPSLELIEAKNAGWFGLFTLVRFRRRV